MQFTRRRILILAVGALLASLLSWWPRRKRPMPATATSRQADLRAWVDTLLPVEPDFPGGLALGVAEQIAAAIEREPAYAKLAREAWAWLDARTRETGEPDFAELPASRRHDLVAEAAASAPGSTPRTFFQATLDDALFHVYANPRAWVGLGYAGPPQPIGFPDHSAAPKAS